MCSCLSFYLSTVPVWSVWECARTVDAAPGAPWSLPAFLSGGRSQLSAGWWSPCTCSARPPSVDAHPLNTSTTQQHPLVELEICWYHMHTHWRWSTDLYDKPWCVACWAHPCPPCNSSSGLPAPWPSLGVPAVCIKFYIRDVSTIMHFTLSLFL